MRDPTNTIPPMPRWQGVHSFPRVWEVARDWMSGQTDAPDDMPATGRLRMAIGAGALDLLTAARVICVEPEQVAALPDWSSPEELIGFARMARLPFDVLYLDLEGERWVPGIAFDDEALEPDYGLGGALCWHDGEALHIAPMGGPHEHAAWPRSFYELNGRVSFRIKAPPISALAHAAAYYVINEPVGGIRCGIELPIAASEREKIDGEWFSTIVSLLAARVLSILYLLESANVELAEAAVSRQVRRQSERKDAKIVLTVRIRSPRRVTVEAASATSGEREFSHRFEVRGHWNHVTRGPIFEAGAPKPCPRCGHCRRIWIPPHVKGPIDKPFVPKVRLWEPHELS